MSNHKIYRFKLNNEIIELIHQFSKMHQYDDKKTYKEKWIKFLETNTEIFEREKQRLIDLGFNKNVEDKMYRSGRYYFRTKSNEKEKEVKKRRKYISCDINFIELIDNHINENLKNLKNDFKPSKEYNNFETIHKNEIEIEIERMLNEIDNNIQKNDIINKIKKTYKNRYYLISHK
jgi:hypothetical protein